jgi:nucleoside-diphosphate-sugar epimerase
MNGQVVITGAAGQIGSALRRRLSAEGIATLNLVRSPQPDQLHPRNGRTGTPDSLGPVSYAAYDAEHTTSHTLAALVNGARAVVNCAGAHHDAIDHLHPAQMQDINAIAPARLAVACQLAGVPLVQLSSTAVSVLEEELAPLAGAYVRSKANAEVLCEALHPGGVSLLRCGWVLNPADDHARARLTPRDRAVVIVGSLPVPLVGLAAVVSALRALIDAAPIGQADLVTGTPTQAELMDVVVRTVDPPPRVVDARTPGRLLRLSRSSVPPTWLAQSVPRRAFDWTALGVDLGNWRDDVRALCGGG